MEEILQNIMSFWKSAGMVYNSGDYTSASILYFKCLFAVADYAIFKRKKRTPNDHTERFRILEEEFKDIYIVIDKLFPLYRDTYSFTVSKEKCEEVKNYVAGIAKGQGIQLNNN